MSDLMFWVCFGLVIVASSFVQRVMGFGYAVVALAVLPFFLDIRDANLIASISLIVPLMWMAWYYRRKLSDLPMIPAVLGACAGIPLGLAAFVLLDQLWLMRGTGVILLYIGLDGLTGTARTTPLGASRTSGVFSGVAAGFLSGSVGVGGPPIAAYASRQGWRPEQFRAFVITFSTLIAGFKLVGLVVSNYLVPGLLDANVIGLTAAAVPFGFVGSRIGTLVANKIEPNVFRRLVYFLLAASAISLIFRTPQ